MTLRNLKLGLALAQGERLLHAWEDLSQPNLRHIDQNSAE